jgi:hypothetical protein
MIKFIKALLYGIKAVFEFALTGKSELMKLSNEAPLYKK